MNRDEIAVNKKLFSATCENPLRNLRKTPAVTPHYDGASKLLGCLVKQSREAHPAVDPQQIAIKSKLRYTAVDSVEQGTSVPS
jgi:hypothetical protein